MLTSALLDERLHIGWRNQPNLVAWLADLAPPKVSPTADFHRDDATLQLAEKLQHLRRLDRALGSVHLRNVLRKIESARDNLRHDRLPSWIVAIPPWHSDDVGGGEYTIRAGQTTKGNEPKLIYVANL